MQRWHHLFYADTHYADAMAESFTAQVDHLARTDLGAAVYRLRADNGAVHYYFAPAAGHVAARFFALPCSEPLPAQRGELIAGGLGIAQPH